MKRYFYILFIYLFTGMFFNLYCQTLKESLPDDVFLYPDKNAQFNPSEDSLYLFLKSNFSICNNSKTSEQIVCRFFINEYGFATNLKLITKNEYNFEPILQEIFYNRKLWIPALVNSTPVKSFRLLSLFCENSQLKIPPYY
jgi:hypothetical protein